MDNLKDWKTTLPAALAAAASFVVAYPTHVPLVNNLAAFVMAGGLLAFGINATSGPKPKT